MDAPPPPGPSDSPDQHLGFWRTGEAPALDAMCRALGPVIELFVHGELWPRTRRWVEPEDVSQTVLCEVVEKILPSLGDEDGSVEFMRRVRTAVRRRVIDAGRRATAMQGESAVEVFAPASEGAPSMGPVTAEDLRRWLAELIDRLPEKYAVVTRMRIEEGLTWDEIGAAIERSPDAAKRRYYRAVDGLARRFS